MSTGRRVALPTTGSLAVLEAGPRGAPSVVFVHGIAQSKQVFERVLAGPLAARLRLVAFDLRGHGDSDAPAPGETLTRADLAYDLAAVIDGLGLARPTIAAWSFGGVVVGEYLRRFGDAALGGLISLAGSVRTGRDAVPWFGPAMMTHARALLSEDLDVYATAARAFISDATAAPIPPAVLEAAVAEMLRVPARVRRPLLAGGEDYTATLAATRVPIATLHGALDPVVLPAMSDLVATARPDVIAVRLAGVGHLPWIEAPDAFDAALADLAAPRDAPWPVRFEPP